MTKNISKTKHVDDLRKQAEKRIPKPADGIGETSEIEVKKLIHELEVHQIELEMQNEALRKSQTEAAESQQKYSDLYDFAPVGYFTFDKKGLIIEANVTGASLLGADKRSLAKQPFQRFIIPGHFSIFQSHLQKAHDLRSKQTCKLKLTGKDGSLFDALIDTIVVIDGEGKFDHYRSAVTNITEITRAEEALRENHELYETLAEKSMAGVYVVQDGKFRFANSNAASYAGYTREEVLNQKADLIVSPEDKEKLRQDAKAMLRGEKRSPYEFRIITKQGETRWILETVTPILHEGRRAILGNSMDITDRKRAEDVLRINEERYRMAQAIGHVGSWEYDLQTAHFWGSDEAKRIYGLDPTQTDFTTDEVEFCIPERERVHQALIDLIKKGKTYNLEFEIHPKNSTEPRIISSIAELHRDEHGAPSLVVGVMQDITGRKQVADALRRSEDNFRHSLEDSPLGMRVVTIDGETLFANRAILDMYGYDSIEELKTTPLIKRYTPESYAEYQTRREKRKRGDYSPSEYDISIVRKDGEVRHLHVFRKEVLWNGERQFQVLYNDITERKGLEEILKKEQQELKLIIDSSPIIIFYKDKEGKFMRVNKTFAEKLKMPEEEFVGKTVFDLYSAKIAQAMTNDDQEVIKTGHPKLNIIEQYESSSGIRWVQTHKIPICDKNGIPFGLIGFAQDITGRKRAEEALKASHAQLRGLAGRLQSAREEQRKQIAREIHDELGGALTGLKIDLSFLVREAPKSRDKTKRDLFLSKIREMTKLIDETIGTVRRVVTELRPSILDDFGLLEALKWQIQEFEKRTGVKCKFVSTMAYVSLDEERSTAAFRIFQESLTNVARHANATRVTATLYKEADSLVLKVEDNGKGLSADDIHNPKSVGLIGMRERALFLGGTVNFSGETSKGTAVSLQFPFKS